MYLTGNGKGTENAVLEYAGLDNDRYSRWEVADGQVTFISHYS